MKAPGSLIAGLLVVFVSAPDVQAQFTFTTNNGALTVTGYTGAGGAVVIPRTTNGLPVCAVGQSAFWMCTNLTDITIPDSVTNIGPDAFARSGLTSVVVPASVSNVGLCAFWACPSLTAITADASNAFYNSVDGVLFDKSRGTLVEYPAGGARSYTIPATVTNVGADAFFECTALANIAIPNSVTVIGDGAFSRLYSLTNIAIPDSVTHVGKLAFADCWSLASVTLGNRLSSIGDSAFANCSSLTSIAIPDSLATIGTSVFMNCTGLTNATISDGVLTIGLWAFNNCSLVQLTIGKSVTSIGTDSFAGSDMTSLVVPNSVTNIGDIAFWYCSSLTNVIIGDCLTVIGKQTFANCPNLARACFLGDAPITRDSLTFDGDTNATVYYLPGTSGWGPMFGGAPTAPWVLPRPIILKNGFGIQTNAFGFTISWATNSSVVIEACTDLTNPTWLPVATNALISGSSYFSDAQWSNYSTRFYRVRSP